MGGKSSNRLSADALIAKIARRQHGVVSRYQLLAAGISRRAIDSRLLDGRLQPLHRGVYLVGVVAPIHAHEMAALLACGHRSVLSHRSAAHLWNLLPADVCITVPLSQRTTRPRITIRRTNLSPRDTRTRHEMRLTSPPRTIFDNAASFGDEYELEALVAEACYRRLASDAELRDQIDRNPGKPGIRALRSILDIPGGPTRTRSPAERLMLRLLRRAGIAGFETNARIHGYEVDVLWRDLGFAVEVDGYDAHSGRVAFERDRLKIATLKARGVGVMPVTGRQLRDDPEGAVGRLLGALASRSLRS